MNREEFYNYILENFNISGEAGRLINNILHFVEENYTEENEQYALNKELKEKGLDYLCVLSIEDLRKQK